MWHCHPATGSTCVEGGLGYYTMIAIVLCISKCWALLPISIAVAYVALRRAANFIFILCVFVISLTYQ